MPLTELWRAGYLALCLPLVAEHLVFAAKLMLCCNLPHVGRGQKQGSPLEVSEAGGGAM